MSISVGLTCAQVPLAWPADVSLNEITPCSTCGIQCNFTSGSTLQLSSRSLRDGITIDESNIGSADYQGQRYTVDECVFHTPGLHVFPGQTDVYPAEYHIYMKSISQPIRTIAIVIPVSHRSEHNGDPAGVAYFGATTAQPSPGSQNPSLQTLLIPGSQVLQYLGVDVRSCATNSNATDEIQYLLSLQVMAVRAADLERIPREGTGSTLPDALPLPGAKPSQAVARDVLLKSTLLATPGILGTVPLVEGMPATLVDTYTCNPLQVIDGKDVIQTDVSGIPLFKVLAGGTDNSGASATGGDNLWMYAAISFVSTMAGLMFADMLFGYVWGWFFNGSVRLDAWLPIKVVLFVAIALASMFWPTATRDGIYGLMNLVFPAS